MMEVMASEMGIQIIYSKIILSTERGNTGNTNNCLANSYGRFIVYRSTAKRNTVDYR